MVFSVAVDVFVEDEETASTYEIHEENIEINDSDDDSQTVAKRKKKEDLEDLKPLLNGTMLDGYK